MSTTTDVREEHLSKEEVEALAHPKRPLKQRVGVVLSYVGMAAIVLYCIIPFYWMVVSSLRLPSEGTEHRVHPEPGVDRELSGRVLTTRTTSAVL